MSITTTLLRHINSTNISSVGSRGRAWTGTMTMCWWKRIPLCVCQVSTTGLESRSAWLACQVITLAGSGNYTLSRIWVTMGITNAISHTRVTTSSISWDGLCGCQPMPTMSFMPLSAALPAICLRNASMPKCILPTAGGRQRYELKLKDNTVLIHIWSMQKVRNTLVRLIFMSDRNYLSSFSA